MKIVKRTLCLISIFILAIAVVGCDKVDNVKVKMGMMNKDFEYINQGKIKKVTIQSTRDKGFKFVIQDKRVINDMYDLFSTAKVVKDKSSLTPDYIFEMDDDNNNVYKFNYVAGLEKNDTGNFYSDNKVYVVSKRIDNDIIQNFRDMRTPKNFSSIYYGAITKALDKFSSDGGKATKLGININDDVQMSKFILSAELESFRSDLIKRKKNEIVLNKGEDTKPYDVIMTVNTYGYTTFSYKMIVTIWDTKVNKETKYYIKSQDKLKEDNWQTTITDKLDKSDFN